MNPAAYPKDHKANLAWRHQLLSRARKDKEFREKLKRLFFEDPIFAFNAFFFTLDVRKRPFHNQPFCTYDFQDDVIIDILDHIKRGEDLVVEKSRDMGASWIFLLCFLWLWLQPEGGGDILLGSRVENYVDSKGDMRALFPKLRYALYKLPRWLWPKGFDRKKHDTFAKLVNPETGSAITGESNNENFSTAGRYIAVFYDEFAKWMLTDESAWIAAGDATPCRLAVSTAFGARGQFYTLVTEGQTKVIRLDFWLHPEKGDKAYCRLPLEKRPDGKVRIRSPWYDLQERRRKSKEMAQEIEIDYIGSGQMVFDGKAWERVQELRGMRREPTKVFRIRLTDMKLDEEHFKPREFEDYFVVWEEPKENFSYAIGVDVVEGVEAGDYATVKVICRQTKNFVAAYYSRIDEVSLARIAVAIAEYYNEAWLGIEVNGPGLATFDLCAEVLGYTKLFMMPSFDGATGAVKPRKGWKTTTSSRNVLIAGVKEWLIDKLGWVDGRTLKEMGDFIRNKVGRPEAKEGAHDDEIFAMGIAIQVDALAPFEGTKLQTKALEEAQLVAKAYWKKRKEPTREELCLQQALEKQKARTLVEDDLGFENLNYAHLLELQLQEVWE